MPSEEFERRIKAKMDSLEHPPHPSVWGGIEARLAEKRKTIFLYRWIWGSAAAFLILLLSTALIWNQTGKSKSPSSILDAPIYSAQENNKHNNPSFSETPVSSKTDKQTSSSSNPNPQPTSETAIDAALSKFESSPTPTNSNRIHRLSISSAAIDLSHGFSSKEYVSPISATPFSSIFMNGMEVDRIRLATTIEQHLPSSIASSPIIQSPWWMEISVGVSMADNRKFRQLSPQGSFLRAANQGSDYMFVESWSLQSPSSPLDEPSPVLLITYPRLSQNAEVNMSYELNNRFRIDGGARYRASENGRIELGNLPVNYSPQGEVSGAQLPIEDYETYAFQQRQVEVPLHVNVYLRNKGRHRLEAGIGSSINLNLVSNKLFEDIERNSKLIDEAGLPRYQNWNAQMEYRLRYEYRLSPQMKFTAGPEFSHLLKGAFSGTSAPEQMRHRFGLRAGIAWKPWR